jgi:hypothetical protein
MVIKKVYDLGSIEYLSIHESEEPIAISSDENSAKYYHTYPVDKKLFNDIHDYNKIAMAGPFGS